MTGAALLAGTAGALGVTGLGALRGPPRPRDAARQPAAIRVMVALGGRIRHRLGARAPAGLHARIVAAGSPGGLGAREVMAAKVGGGVLGACVALLLAAPAPGRLGLLLAVAGPAAGFLAPDWWLMRRARERARLVRRDLPALLDLLRVSIDAGLSPVAALAAVGGRAEGPLATEWRAVGREVSLGVSLEEALAGTAQRLPMPEVVALGAALNRAARHGAPLSNTLAAQARDARLARRRAIEEEAAKAGPKIQLVVALLLVPSVLLLVAAALAAAFLGGGGLPVG